MTPLLEQLKDKIHNKISELNFSTWIKPIIDASVQDDVLNLLVPNKFVADWINDYYKDLITQEIFEITQKNCRITYDILPDSEEEALSQSPIQQTQPVPVSAKVAHASALNSKYTFERFVVGSSNQFAHAACKSVSDMPGGRYNPLFIYGGVGLGKTHLLHAIGLQMLEQNQSLHVVYVSGEKFMNDLINALRYQKTHEFRIKYREKCDILLIDDIQFLGGKERTQEEFFHTFNTLHDSQRQIVLTSDKSPKEIQGIEERLRSRLEWGLIADIGPPDLETRIAILRKKAEASGLSCPDDVAMYLASSIKSNVRELEGSLIRINAFASLAGTAMTLDFAKEVLGTSIQEQTKRCSIEMIQKIVAEFFKITISDLKSPKRIRGFSHPRQIAMYLCKKHVHSSFPEIGQKFGGKDHTTVMHACKKIEAVLLTSPDLQNDINQLEKIIRA